MAQKPVEYDFDTATDELNLTWEHLGNAMENVSEEIQLKLRKAMNAIEIAQGAVEDDKAEFEAAQQEKEEESEPADNDLEKL